MASSSNHNGHNPGPSHQNPYRDDVNPEAPNSFTDLDEDMPRRGGD